MLIYVAVNFGTGRFRIEGSSMEPSMHPNQYVLVDKVSYMLGDPKRGDVIVFNYPLAPERDFIKRIIGLPGETVTVAQGVVSIDGVPLDEPYISAPPTYENTWTLAPDEYFVLGDNRNSSSDSHSWGPLPRHEPDRPGRVRLLAARPVGVGAALYLRGHTLRPALTGQHLDYV